MDKIYKVFVSKLEPLTEQEKEAKRRDNKYYDVPQRNGIYFSDFKEFPVMEVALTEKEFQAMKKNVVEVIS